MSNNLTPVNFYKGTYQQITSLNDASKSEYGLYFSNSPSYDIYSFDDASQLVSYTQLNITGSGPAINSYNSSTKTLNRRNLNATDISTGLGYIPLNLNDLNLTWVQEGSSNLFLKIRNINDDSSILSAMVPVSVGNAGLMCGEDQIFTGIKHFVDLGVFIKGIDCNGSIKSYYFDSLTGATMNIGSNMTNGYVINIGNASLNDGSISYWISCNGEYYSGKSNSAFTISAFNGSSYTGNEIENINSTIASIPSLEMLKVWHGTASEYASLSTKDPSTIYFVEE